MSKRLSGVVVLLWMSGAWLAALDGAHAQGGPPPAPPSSPSSARAVVGRYCVTCHNGRLKTGGLALDALNLDNVAADAEVWEKVTRKLRAGAMPPVGAPRPDQTTSDGLAAWLEATLDRAAVEKPNPGAPALHRLNRAEYANSIRDLIALEVDTSSLLPPDDSSSG